MLYDTFLITLKADLHYSVPGSDEKYLHTFIAINVTSGHGPDSVSCNVNYVQYTYNFCPTGRRSICVT